MCKGLYGCWTHHHEVLGWSSVTDVSFAFLLSYKAMFYVQSFRMLSLNLVLVAISRVSRACNSQNCRCEKYLKSISQ